MDKAQPIPSSETKKMPRGGTITTKINQDGGTTIICDGLNSVHIGQTASISVPALATTTGFFRSPPKGCTSQLPNVMKGIASSSATVGSVVVIQNSKDVKFGDNLSFDFTVRTKKKSSRKHSSKEPRKIESEELEISSQSPIKPR